LCGHRLIPLRFRRLVLSRSSRFPGRQ
jgi:hypothetical protein